jgi:hypothetical protein
VINPITQQANHAGHILVEHSHHRPGLRKEAHAGRVLAQDTRSLGIVSHVEDDRGTTRQTWKRPGRSTSMKPWRTACIGTGRTSRKASQAAITAAAFSN